MSFIGSSKKPAKRSFVIEVKFFAASGMLVSKKTQTCVTDFDTGATNRNWKGFEKSVSEGWTEWGKFYYELEISRFN